MLGLTSASLMLSLMLSGCAGSPSIKEVAVAPPVEYMVPQAEPAVPAKPVTNGGLAEYAANLLQALRAANADLNAIRAWADSLSN